MLWLAATLLELNAWTLLGLAWGGVVHIRKTAFYDAIPLHAALVRKYLLLAMASWTLAQFCN